MTSHFCNIYKFIVINFFILIGVCVLLLSHCLTYCKFLTIHVNQLTLRRRKADFHNRFALMCYTSKSSDLVPKRVWKAFLPSESAGIAFIASSVVDDRVTVNIEAKAPQLKELMSVNGNSLSYLSNTKKKKTLIVSLWKWKASPTLYFDD